MARPLVTGAVLAGMIIAALLAPGAAPAAVEGGGAPSPKAAAPAAAPTSAPKEDPNAANLLVTVNGQKVTEGEMGLYLAKNISMLQYFQMSKGAEIFDQNLQRKIYEILLVQYARKTGIEPAIRKGPYRFREATILANDYAYREINAKYTVTDEALEARMPKHLGTYKIRQIVLPSKEEAEAVLAELRGGGDFIALIKEKSIGIEARKDGLLWDYREGQGSFWTKADELYILDLPLKEYSRPVEMGIGWAVVRVEELKNPPPGMRENAKGRLRGVLRNEHYQAEMDRRFKDLVYDVATDEEMYKLTRDWWVAKLPPSTKVVGRRGDMAVTFAELTELQKTNPNRNAEPKLEEMFDKLKGMPTQLIKDHIMAEEARATGFTPSKGARAAMDYFLNNALVEELEKREITSKVKVTEAELKPYFEANLEKFTVKEAVRVRQIVVKDLAEAMAMLEDVKSGRDFTILVRENSIDPSTQQVGGDLGFIERGMYIKEFEDVIFSMSKPDEVYKEPIKSPFGYHIVQFLDRRQRKTPAFAEVKEKVRQTMIDELTARLKSERLDEIIKKADIKRQEKAITAARDRFVASFKEKTEGKQMDFQRQHTPMKNKKMR